MINHTKLQSRHENNQVWLQEAFQKSSGALAVVRQKTVEILRESPHLEEPERTRIVERAEDLIRSLEEIADEAADSAYLMSAPENEVNASQSAEYLQQELVRGGLLKKLQDWKKRHDLHVMHITKESRGTTDAESPEKRIYELIVQHLLEDLSRASDQEKCFRALLVLKEIQDRRGAMSLSFLATPVHSIRSLAATVLSSAIFLGVSTGITLGVASTGMQYASTGIDNWTKSQQFTIPERRALDTIYTYAQTDRGMVILLISQAGIRGNIDDILSARKAV